MSIASAFLLYSQPSLFDSKESVVFIPLQNGGDVMHCIVGPFYPAEFLFAGSNKFCTMIGISKKVGLIPSGMCAV